MYFRDRLLKGNQDMYFEVRARRCECSISRVDTGQISPLALGLFAHQN